MNDLKFAFRQLFKNPGFTAVAVITLALGIGATTALFSVVYGVLISPYPYARPQEIWMPGLVSAQAEQRMRSYRQEEYLEMATLPAFSEVMATRPGSLLLSGEFAPETIRAVEVSANAFRFLGVRPLFGRTIDPSDVHPTGEPEPVAVLSFGRWQRLFGNDTNILGKTLRLDDRPYTIVGVMPPRFGWWTDNGLWVPMAIDSRVQRGVFPLARLSPGVSSSAAQQQLHALQLELAKLNPRGFPKESFITTLSNYLDMTVARGSMQRSLRLLFVAVGLLLLIACANVANLQLARATSRGREMAIRLSIGAGRGQLIRQLLTESVLVSALGGLLGLLFTFWIIRLMVALMPGNFVPNEARIEVNNHVLLFCAAISVLTGILFGLAPALQLSRPEIVESLKDEARTSTTSMGGRTRSILVVVEIALAMVLLVSAGLTVRSLLALKNVELGFRPENVINVELTLPPKKYATWNQRNQFAAELLDRVKHIPGIAAATIGFGGLPFGAPDFSYSLEGQADAQVRRITVQAVAADFLKTLRIPLRRGRMLTERDIDLSEQVAVINETAAKLWPEGQDPIGRRIHLDDLEKLPPQVFAPTNLFPYVTVVGVIADARNDDLQSRTQPAVLLPFTLLAPPQRTLTLRTQANPAGVINAVRAQVRQMDAELPLNAPRTFEEILDSQEAHPRFITLLFGLFGALGLSLAMAGIYSVLSYAVSKRTREIGVRIALGAQRGDVLRLIFKSGAGLVGLGVVLGLVASLVAARLLISQIELFQVNSTDPVSFVGVIALLTIVAGAACFVPARRAAKVDPMEALRYE
jgi:predicted permease